MGEIRRFVRLGVLLVLLGLMTGVLGGTASGGSSGNGPDPALVNKLKEKARGSVALSTKKATKHVGFVRAGQNGDLLPGNSGSAKAKGKDFLGEYGSILGAGNESTLDEISSSTDSLGATHVTYQQFYKDVPVWGGTIKAHTDADGNLTAVNGVAVPDISVNTAPRLSADQAGARAIATVVADPPVDESGKTGSLSASDLRVSSAKLYVYRTGLPKGTEGTSQLVYEVIVTNGTSVRDVVFVHAHAGKVINRYSTTTDALHRVLYEQSPSTPPVWEEGQPFPGALNQDQQNLVNFSGDSYRHFFNAFGRDSYDGLGAFMRTVNNDPTISCPNANWNGSTTNYCNGVTSDDVVAHEWGHAYTQYTHDLIYQWQPGALNESYSDIWGETVDLINGAGTDTPGAVRSVGSCSTHTTPIPVLIINTPTPGECPAGSASFGPPLTSAGTTGDLVLSDDGVAPTSDACTPIVNAAAVAGKIGLADRGTCAFTIKVKNLQNAGAIAAVIADNVAGSVAGMAGADPTITIPSLRITLAHGNLLKGYLSSGSSNVTLKVKGGTAPPEDSYRWLMGEDATAFGSAIRDMWTPTCKGDPGKVSDAEYHCSPDDGGGVHSNSGVPNHGYALLVDGGTYNGQTITAIGLVKAAHLYWRAQSVYQTPTTDFDDHADALEASCVDLIGQSLAGLSTGGSVPSSGQAITAADCAEVTDMIAAVELRTDPTEQCNFTTLLKGDAPAVCVNSTPKNIHTEDFEDGLAGWTLSNQGVFAGGWPGTNWVADNSLPGGRAGTAAFAQDLDGQCSGGAGDVSGVMRMTSPAIQLKDKKDKLAAAKVTFEHYVATELGWDGGNLKISINGGAYVIVPASAFTFNPYNTVLQPAAAGNTNPLAGEPGFSGTDGGQVHGSWGQSQIDLSRMGVKDGDTIQIRFDFGMDGCGAVDGWYVDDFKVSACKVKQDTKAKKD